MKPRAAGVLRTLEDLLASKLGGQLHRGDTLGLWTFNKELQTGRVPLQFWSPRSHRTMELRLENFLGEQPYENSANLGKVLPAVETVIKNSDFITVILITEGGRKMHGTPFDDRINEVYKVWFEAQRQVRMPFITVLRAQHGKITDYSVSPAPWPVEMPPLPAELQVVETPPAKPAPPPRKEPPPTAAPFILRGKKPEQTVTPTQDATASKVGVPTPAPEVAKPTAAPAAPDKPLLESSPLPQAAGAPGDGLKVEVGKEPAPAPAGTAPPAKAEAPASTLKSEPVPKPGAESKPPAGPAGTPALPVVVTAPPPQPTAAPEVTASATATTAGPTPAPNTAGAPAGPPALPVTTEPAPAPQTSALPGSASVPSPAAQDAVAVPPQTFFGRTGLWLAGLILLAAVVGFVWLALRRGRATAQASLITRSLDRQKKS